MTAAYEPGSVEKMITASAAINEGKSSPLDTVTIPPALTIDGQTFTDAFDHGTEQRTLAGILGYSMNTGTVMIGSRLSKQQRYDYLTRFGIGQAPDIGLPAETSGILAKPDQWDDRQQYTVLFGQGVSQSTLQTVRAYQSIANDGVMLQPRLIDGYVGADGAEEKVPAKDSQQVVTKETAQQVRDILESNVTMGEVKDAAIDGYRVGAKTGTSQAPREDGLPGFDGYTASIVGMAPMDNPRFIVEVVLQRPRAAFTASPKDRFSARSWARSCVPTTSRRPPARRRGSPVRQIGPARQVVQFRQVSLLGICPATFRSNHAVRGSPEGSRAASFTSTNGDHLVRAE